MDRMQATVNEIEAELKVRARVCVCVHWYAVVGPFHEFSCASLLSLLVAISRVLEKHTCLFQDLRPLRVTIS